MTPSPNQPELVTTVVQLRRMLSAVRRAGKAIGLVPTMGALHEGHLSLVRASKAECDYTVVTVFVNSAQFAAGEEFERYPRTLKADLAALAGCGAELVFAPPVEEVYPPGCDTWVEVGSVARPLEGEFRPGHFRGVATVVLKLLNMVGPDVAYFGQKDHQQVLVIKRLVRDLNVPVSIHVCPTVREADGLAMSSRNAYLSPAGRRSAIVLSRSLDAARELVAGGQRSAALVAERMREVILSAEDARIDYVALVDPETLEPVRELKGPTLAAVAVKIENTRLIDNCLLEPVPWSS